MSVLDRRAPATTVPPTPEERSDAMHWWRPLAAASFVAAGAVFAGFTTPRGPVEPGESLVAMAIALVVGGCAGWLLRSRALVLGVPVWYAVAFELTRLPAQGPTVDAVNLDEVYGLLAAVSGRGVHGLLVFPALLIGGLAGVRSARRHRVPRTNGRRRLDLISTLLGLLALGAAAGTVLVPARTDPIRDADDRVVGGSVAELVRVPVTTGELTVLVRGVDTTNPVLLYLAGGPGGSEFGAMRRHGQELEREFVVATLDQRGTGSSYDQLEPVATYTLDTAITDVIEVADHLRRRFGDRPVYLVGQSWGSLLGVLAVQQRPELFAAFVGVGQMVDIAETDRIFYDDTLAWARGQGDTRLAARLEAAGPPPYADLLNYPLVLSHEQQVYPYDHSVNAEGAGQMLENLPVPEYSPLDLVNIVRGLLDTFATLYPQLQDVDLRQTAVRLEVPVHLVEGRYEPRGRKALARQWFELLQAPSKRWSEFDTSGHRPLFEQPAEFAKLMRTVAGEP